MLIELAIAVIGGVGMASVIVSRMDRQDAQRHPGGWQPRDGEGNTPDHSGGWVGYCPNGNCIAARQNLITGRHAWETAADERAEELGVAQAANYTAAHRYVRAAEPERYNAQHEISWAQAAAELLEAHRVNQMDEQIRTHGLTPDMGIAWRAGQAGEVDYSQPTASEQAYLGAGQQLRLEARNNDGSEELIMPQHFSGRLQEANLRGHGQRGGWVRSADGDDVWDPEA
jgi:hypothetical protein